MTREECAAALKCAELELTTAVDESMALLNAQGFLDGYQQLEFNDRMKAARAKVFHFKGELRKLTEGTP